MKKIYLHLGFSKTASTSFQVTCKENIKVLEEQGFAYPLFNSSAIQTNWVKNIKNHGPIFYSLYCETPETFVGNIRYKVSDYDQLHKDYISILEQCLSSNKKVILSGERIAELPLAKLYEFKNYLLKFNAEIIPLVIVRSPYEYHCSQYQQAIKSGFVVDFTQWASQAIIIKNVKEVFPDTEFFPFRQICKHKFGPSGFLFEKMGLSCNAINFQSSNEGKPNTLIRLQQALNKEESVFNGEVSENYLLQVLNDQNPHIINGSLNDKYKVIHNIDNESFQSKFYLTEEEFEKIKENFEKENKFFIDVFGKEFCDTNIKFSSTENFLKELAKYVFSANQSIKKNNIEYSALQKKLDTADKEIQTLKTQLNSSKKEEENIAQALKEFSQKLNDTKIKPSVFYALRNLICQIPLKKKAFSLCNTGKIYEAECIGLSYTSNNPYISWGYYILGKVYWKQGKQELALQNLNKAIEIDPHITYYRVFAESCKKNYSKAQKTSIATAKITQHKEGVAQQEADKQSSPPPITTPITTTPPATFDNEQLKILYSLQIALFNAQMDKEKEVYIPTFDKPSKLVKLERTTSGALCFASNISGQNYPPIAIVTVPKSGTYLLARFLTKLGYIDTRTHISAESFNDHREYNIYKFADGIARIKQIPLATQMQLVAEGSFFASHLMYQHAELLQGKSILLSVRDLRTSLVSYMRYMIMRDPKRNNKPAEFTESELYNFMLSSGRVTNMLTRAKSMVIFKNKYPKNLVQFEEIAQAPLSEQLTSVKNLAHVLNRDISEIISALAEARGEQTLTYSGSHSSLDGLWSERVEARFQELGGHELNENLGYAREWKKS